MKMKRMVCAILLICLLVVGMSAQAAGIERAWMEYEDYSGNRLEQSIENEKTLAELEKILNRAKQNPAKLDGCTVNCTLFCMVNGEIYDFACATDGCPYIQSRDNSKTYTLGVDYQRFWEIFSQVRDGMGYEASSVFDW